MPELDPQSAHVVAAMEALDRGEEGAQQILYDALSRGELLISLKGQPPVQGLDADQKIKIRTIETAVGTCAVAFTDIDRARDTGIGGDFMQIGIADLAQMIAPTAMGIAINEGAAPPSGLVSPGWVIGLANGVSEAPGVFSTVGVRVDAGTQIGLRLASLSPEAATSASATLAAFGAEEAYFFDADLDGAVRPTVIAIVDEGLPKSGRGKLAHAVQLALRPFMPETTEVDVMAITRRQFDAFWPAGARAFYAAKRN